MYELYLLPIDQWLHSLVLASAVLSDPGRDVFFVDLEQIDTEVEALAMLRQRLPLDPVSAAVSLELEKALDQAGLSWRRDQLTARVGWAELTERFGLPGGICIADAALPELCLKAAVLAVRLGYYFIPSDDKNSLDALLGLELPLLWVGSKSTLEEQIVSPTAKKISCLENDSEALAFLSEKGLPVDYLVIANSADLDRETERGDCLGELWVRGLSLHAMTLASYRNIYLFDAASPEPDPALIEEAAGKLACSDLMKLRFQVVLASPAAIPFFYEEKNAVGAVTEEMVRDIHLPLNGDLFFDLAEGRLMQHSPGGLAVQLISTRRYREMQSYIKRDGKDVLIVSTPHVDTGIIFSTDEALIDTQLVPLLNNAGWRVKQLQYRDAHYEKVSEALGTADYFLFTGHGGPEGLHTHGRTMNRDDLPILPPLVAFASACSTVGLVPHWYSLSEGLEWQGVPVDSRQVIGLSFVEKGAVAFVGGATIEDLQYTTSTYTVFMEALLLKGLSVGEAIREMRHIISLYAFTLLQKSPDAYRKYRWGTANSIHQLVLLGDPAFTPSPKVYSKAEIPRRLEGKAELQRLTVDIPADYWRRSQASINPKEASKYYYRCRSVEVITPCGEDVFSWGDYYRVAPDAKNISDSAVKSSFIHLTLDLPEGLVPKRLELVEAELGQSECLLCGEEVEHPLTPLDAMKKFKLPYLLQPPIELNMESGWAFGTELCHEGIKLHWLAPLLLIDEKNRSAYPLQKFTFELEAVPGRSISGRVTGTEAGRAYLVAAGYEFSEQVKGISASKVVPGCTVAAALTDRQGCFKLELPPGAQLTLHEQFPLYDLLEDYAAYRREYYRPDENGEILILPAPADHVQLTGFVIDTLNGKALQGALIRVFRGELDPVGDPLIEAYAGEAHSGSEGEFALQLVPGRYILYAAAEIEGRRYKSAHWTVILKVGQNLSRIFSLDQAAVVRGRIAYDGYIPPDPVVIGLKKYPAEEGESALVRVPVHRDGSYECLVSFQDCFSIVLEEEGWQAVNDTNNGLGYKLEPQQLLERSFTLLPAEGER